MNRNRAAEIAAEILTAVVSNSNLTLHSARGSGKTTTDAATADAEYLTIMYAELASAVHKAANIKSGE